MNILLSSLVLFSSISFNQGYEMKFQIDEIHNQEYYGHSIEDNSNIYFLDESYLIDKDIKKDDIIKVKFKSDDDIIEIRRDN